MEVHHLLSPDKVETHMRTREERVCRGHSTSEVDNRGVVVSTTVRVLVEEGPDSASATQMLYSASSYEVRPIWEEVVMGLKIYSLRHVRVVGDREVRGLVGVPNRLGE